MVGLWVRPGHQGLLAGLERMQRAREERNPRMLAKLNELGLALKHGGGGGPKRRRPGGQAPFCQGPACQRPGGFNGRGVQPLAGRGRGGLCSQGAHESGGRHPPDSGPRAGCRCWPTPGCWTWTGRAWNPCCIKFKKLGLEGLEAYYSDHDEATRRSLVSLAARLGLGRERGQRFPWRDSKPQVKLGQGKGDLRVPATLLAALKQRRDRIREESGDA
jgi:hypothetical protein